MSKNKQAEEMFRADPSLTAKEVSEKLGMHISQAYNARRKIVGAVFNKTRKTKKNTKEKTMKVVSIHQEPNISVKQFEDMSNSNILLQAQLDHALRELEDCRVVIRYLEKKINADAV